MALVPFDIREAFPPEIRARIFRYCLVRDSKEHALEQYHAETCVILSGLRDAELQPTQNHSDEYELALEARNDGYERIRNSVRKTPVLLIALRCAPDLYSQALEIYYRINTFDLSPQWANLPMLSVHRDLSQTTLKSIKKLEVVTDCFDWDGLLIADGGRMGRPAKAFSEEAIKNFNLSRAITQMSNLQFLRVKLVVNSWEDCSVFLNMVRRLKKLTRVQLQVCANCPVCYMHPDYTGIIVDGMNKVWGVSAKLLQVNVFGGEFFWQAPQGRTLTWSWTVYREELLDHMKRIRSYGDCYCSPPLKVGGLNPFSYDDEGGKWYVGPEVRMRPYWYTQGEGDEEDEEEDEE